MVSLDLLVFVPIEAPDRVPVDRAEQRWRARVDDALRDLVLDDALDPGVEALEVRVRSRPASVRCSGTSREPLGRKPDRRAWSRAAALLTFARGAASTVLESGRPRRGPMKGNCAVDQPRG